MDSATHSPLALLMATRAQFTALPDLLIDGKH